MNRRTWLGIGLAGSAVLAVGGAAGWFVAGSAWRNGHLVNGGRAVLEAVARAVLDGVLPEAPAPRQAALRDHLARMESTIAALAPAAQHEFGELVTVLATAPGRRALAGLDDPWPDASVEAVQAMLQGLRTSRWQLRRAAYHALRDLTHAAWFADERTWPLLGYPGPLKLA